MSLTEIVNSINYVLKDEVLDTNKYRKVMKNENDIRKMLFDNIIKNDNYNKTSVIQKSNYIYSEALNFYENNNDVEIQSNNANIVMSTWVDINSYYDAIDNPNVIENILNPNPKFVSSQKELLQANNYVYAVTLPNHDQLKVLLENTQNRYITIPIKMIGNVFNLNTGEPHSSHIGLFVVDLYKLETYFFDPNGKQAYFETIQILEKKEDENQYVTTPRNAFDDIEMTFNEYAFLTGHHNKKNANDYTISKIFNDYSKLISENLNYVEQDDFYKFIPNSNMLSASFDKGSCVTWTLILDNILHKNEESEYSDIIKELCNLTLIDSQKMCYQYQCGLYEIYNMCK